MKPQQTYTEQANVAEALAQDAETRAADAEGFEATSLLDQARQARERAERFRGYAAEQAAARGLTADEFVGEVIGIARLDSFSVETNFSPGVPNEERVTAKAAMTVLGTGPQTNMEGKGRTMGQAFAALREQVRMEYGR